MQVGSAYPLCLVIQILWHKPEQENIYEELATIEITSEVGDEIAVKEKIYTYEEISELEGRREKTIYDQDWDGRYD